MRAKGSEVKPAAAGTRFSDTVSYRMEHGVLVVTIDNPPVNAASATMRAGLNCAIVHAGITEEVRAVVIIGSGRSFVGGADIREFGQPMAEPTLPQVVELIEASDKPVVAALNGVALGGGCEIALACHYRIASKAARIGLPEVKLGIVPGAGGTQRLPRLTGTLAAAEMIATGRIIGAEEAQSLGIVDKVTDGDLARQAIAAARRLVVTPPRRTGELAVAVGKGADVDALADKVLAKARGQIAPAEAIRLVRLAAEASLADGLAEERATFLMLRDSEQSKALRHVFFAERAAAKVPGIEHVEPRPVATIGVIGAGLMGSGIAVSALNAGYRVICIEQTAERATAGEKRIVGAARSRGRIGQARRRWARRPAVAARGHGQHERGGDRRPGDRGGVRRPDGQDGPLPRARQARPAGCHPGDQYELSRSRCHRGSGPAS